MDNSRDGGNLSAFIEVQLFTVYTGPFWPMKQITDYTVLATCGKCNPTLPSKESYLFPISLKNPESYTRQ